VWWCEVKGKQGQVDGGFFLFLRLRRTLGEMDLVAVPMGVSIECNYQGTSNSLFCLFMILQLEHVNFQHLAVLAHLAKDDSSCLVEIGIYDRVRFN
jgi:hypothetical protein